MYTEKQIAQFKENLNGLHEDLKRNLHPQSIKMVKSDINRINEILNNYK